MKITGYVHGDRGYFWTLAEEYGLEGEAARMFAHAADEHKIVYDVAEDGTATPIEIDGMRIVRQEAGE